MKSKREKLAEVIELLHGNPPKRPTKIWVTHTRNGVTQCDMPGWPEEVQPHDITININEQLE